MKQIRDTYIRGFSIIEVMIGIFVFALGLVAVFGLLTSSLSVNDMNKNSIIAGQLAREQIELIRNIRDTNYKKLKIWNQHDPEAELSILDISDGTKVFSPNTYYFIENDFNTSRISVESLGSTLPEGVENLAVMNPLYGLCFDNQNRYVKCSSINTTPTRFYKYVKVEQVIDDGNIIEDALMITSKVIWYKRGYHDLEMKTIITDWRRI